MVSISNFHLDSSRNLHSNVNLISTLGFQSHNQNTKWSKTDQPKCFWSVGGLELGTVSTSGSDWGTIWVTWSKPGSFTCKAEITQSTTSQAPGKIQFLSKIQNLHIDIPVPFPTPHTNLIIRLINKICIWTLTILLQCLMAFGGSNLYSFQYYPMQYFQQLIFLLCFLSFLVLLLFLNVL